MVDENKLIANAQKSAQFDTYYDERWKTLTSSDEWLGNVGYGKVRVDFIDEVIEDFDLGTSLNILDLGCGTGWLSRALCRYGTVTGVDFAPDTITAANEVYGECGTFLVADPSSPTLGLPENMYDLIVASEVIEHVEDHAALLTQIQILLKPNGWLILTTPNQNLKRHVMADPRKQKYIQPIENWLTPNELRKLLAQHGFYLKLHIGFTTAKNFGYTLTQKIFGHRITRRVVEKVGLNGYYRKLVLPVAMYQMIISQRANN